MRLKYVQALIAIILVTLSITPLLAPYVSALGATPTRRWRAYVSPLVYDESVWRFGGYVEDSSLALIKLEGESLRVVDEAGFARVVAVLAPGTSIGALRGKAVAVLAVLPAGSYNMALLIVRRGDIEKLASTEGVLAIFPDERVDAMAARERERFKQIEELEGGGYEPLQTTGGAAGGYHYTVNLTRAIDVWTEFGITGENVIIAIVDTGVDYASPGLGLDAIARDESGAPMILDADSLGLVLTPVVAQDPGDGYIYVDYSNLYVFYPPYYVYKWWPSINVTACGYGVSAPLPTRWYVGNIPRYGPVKFGLGVRMVSTAVGTITFTFPVILVDSNGDEAYDTAYVDISTTFYVVGYALQNYCNITVPGWPPPDSGLFSFSDEEPIRIGSEIAAYDSDGDGYYDFSIGTLAGYVFDAAFAILLEYLGILSENLAPLAPGYGVSTYNIIASNREMWRGEPVAAIWPGIGYDGRYVVLHYDYDSHGTFCAGTAAGRGIPVVADRPGVFKLITGQAPGAKIAAAGALYMGDLIVSNYFFSGFDLVTEYGYGSQYLWSVISTNPWIDWRGLTWKWVYTGAHKADMTSNSWGSSTWAIWGWAAGMDPTSVVMTYITLVSGTPIFVAAGNGGFGWGTVASPAASPLVITVGAATEFTYRPIYGYLLAGGNSLVIQWSNRGPSEVGVPKPDILAVGAFAWATGRPWDALGTRVLRGMYAYALFSGTSQATPMVAGAAALVVSAYKKAYGSYMPAPLLKTILLSSARDVGFDELSQGAGFVDAYRAVELVFNPSAVRVYSLEYIHDVLRELGASIQSMTYGERAAPAWFEPKIFVPAVMPGGFALRTLTIEGSGSVRVYSERLQIAGVKPFCDLVVAVLSPTVITSCAGDTMVFNVTRAAATITGYAVLDMSQFLDADLFELEFVYPYEIFDSTGRALPPRYPDRISSTYFELWLWVDVNRDGRMATSETARITYDSRGANLVALQVARLKQQIDEIAKLNREIMGIDITQYPVYLLLVARVTSNTYVGPIQMKARAVLYKFAEWSDVKVFPGSLDMNGVANVTVIIRAPSKPGYYSGFVVVEDLSSGRKIKVPVGFFVPIVLARPDGSVTLVPQYENSRYRNHYLRGAFDYTWRYESGEWRVFKVYVPRETAGITVVVSWPDFGKPSYSSNIDVQVYGPWSYMMVDDETGRVYTFAVDGVQLAGEVTYGPVSGYRFRAFWDVFTHNTSIIVAPTPTPGFYRLVVRNIQFSGNTFEEPVTIAVYAFSMSLRTLPYYTRGSRASFELLLRSDRIVPVTAVEMVPEAVYANASGRFYVDLAASPIVSLEGVTALINRPYFVPAVVLLRVLMSFSSEALPGDYTLAFNLRTAFPVTAAGYINASTKITYFDWWYIPVYPTLRVR